MLRRQAELQQRQQQNGIRRFRWPPRAVIDAISNAGRPITSHFLQGGDAVWGQVAERYDGGGGGREEGRELETL